jgi:membrane-associated phospholipid phosphatase
VLPKAASLSPRLRAGLIALPAGVILILAARLFADHAVAHFVQTLPWAREMRAPELGFPILVILSGCGILAGAWQALRGQTLHRLTECAILASFSLTWAVCLDEFVLKRLFGRETPDVFLQTGSDHLHWLQGSQFDSFPSGHAVQIVSVGTVFLLGFPRYRALWLSGMAAVCIALVLGNWHFVSDVIAGAGVGAIGGLAAVVLWKARAQARAWG